MKVLILPASGIGDTVMTLPVAGLIKKNFPGAKVDILVDENGSEQVCKYYPHVDNVLLNKFCKYTALNLLKYFLLKFQPIIRLIRKNKYDLIISPIPNVIRRSICIFGGAKRTIYGKDKSTHPLLNIVNLLKPLKISNEEYDYGLDIGDSTQTLKKFNLKRHQYLVIDPYPAQGENDLRKWPHISELIKILKTRKTVVLVGRKEGHEDIEGTVDLINRTTISELLHILKNAKLSICSDVGTMHLSYALNTKVLGMFGPIDPKNRIPIGNSNLIPIYTNQTCSPCTSHRVTIQCKNKSNPNICMRSITITQILDQINQIDNK